MSLNLSIPQPFNAASPLPAGVESISDTWGTVPPPNDPEHFEQLPASTFAPPPVDVAPLDYDETMAVILDLETKAQELRMQIAQRCVA
jgi:hypothetical protein